MIDGFSEPWPGGREGKREVAGVEDGSGRVRWRGSGAGVQGREGRWARGAGRPGGPGPTSPARTTYEDWGREATRPPSGDRHSRVATVGERDVSP